MNNLGNIYFRAQNYKNATDYYKKAYGLKEKTGNQKEQAIILNQLGVCYANRGNYKEALHYLEKAQKIAITNNYTQLLASISENIKNVELNISGRAGSKTEYDIEQDKKQEQYISALKGENIVIQRENLKSLEEIEKLSFENQAKELKLHLVQGKYEKQLLENKIKEQNIKLLDAENKLTKAELKEKQENLKNLRNIILLVISGFCAVSALLIIIYRLYRNKKKSLTLLKEQHEKINRQKQEIQEQSKLLTQTNVELVNKNELLKIQQDELIDINNKLAESENSLRELVATKYKFFSIISHDLRTPVVSMQSFTRIIKQYGNTLTKEEKEQMLGELDIAVKRIASLLENLLLWARSQSNLVQINRENVNINNIIENIIQLFDINAKNKNISLSNDIPTRRSISGIQCEYLTLLLKKDVT